MPPQNKHNLINISHTIGICTRTITTSSDRSLREIERVLIRSQ